MKAKTLILTLAFLLSSLWIAGIQEAQVQDQTYTNSIGMEFVLIPAGKLPPLTFETATDDTITHQRLVTISKPFYLGKYQVTQEQWVAVMGEGSNPSENKGRTNPVAMVSWEDVQEFIQKLNEKEGHRRYRLPTEAEWEHAARAGTETGYFFGNDPAALSEYAWFDDNALETYPVGQKKPNPWELYDIYGNVWEWVQDWYTEFLECGGMMIDPTGPSSGSFRVFRGGSYGDSAEHCRSAYRDYSTQDYRHNFIGFRLALYPGQ